MPANLSSELILREIQNHLADMHKTVCKTRLLIAESEGLIQKADDLLKKL